MKSNFNVSDSGEISNQLDPPAEVINWETASRCAECVLQWVWCPETA